MTDAECPHSTYRDADSAFIVQCPQVPCIDCPVVKAANRIIAGLEHQSKMRVFKGGTYTEGLGFQPLERVSAYPETLVAEGASQVTTHQVHLRTGRFRPDHPDPWQLKAGDHVSIATHPDTNEIADFNAACVAAGLVQRWISRTRYLDLYKLIPVR